MEPRSAVAPATPMTIPATDTIPSLAPSTPARSQFNRPARLPECGSRGCVGRSLMRRLGPEPVARVDHRSGLPVRPCRPRGGQRAGGKTGRAAAARRAPDHRAALRAPAPVLDPGRAEELRVAPFGVVPGRTDGPVGRAVHGLDVELQAASRAAR